MMAPEPACRGMVDTSTIPNEESHTASKGKCWVNNHARAPVPSLGSMFAISQRGAFENRDITPYVTWNHRAKLTKSGAGGSRSPPTPSRATPHCRHPRPCRLLRTKRRAAIEAYDELRRSTFARMFDDPSRNAFGFPTGDDRRSRRQHATWHSEKSGDAGEFRVLGMET